ncbi:MAG: sensor histidine kinase, partial [Pseudomonadota bacterium]|nr:sensor histidine kinase [Pseudomonadota bacterium]
LTFSMARRLHHISYFYSNRSTKLSLTSGLGLAIAQRIAERHNGRLSLSGRSDGGEGLCVVVELPLAPA